jgi:hypothetical protein
MLRSLTLLFALTACGEQPATTEAFADLLAECDAPEGCAEALPGDQLAPPATRLWSTCGDPVCRGYTGGSGLPLCGARVEGDRCPPRAFGAMCDPMDACNRMLECRRVRSPGPCPISRAAYKQDIAYLLPGERAALAKRLLSFPLATWRYTADGAQGPVHTGFIIDDVEGSAAVAPDGEHVDLYGYTSMAVALLQEQQVQLDQAQRDLGALRAELAALRAELAAR